VGKYRVNLNDIAEIGAKAIVEATERAELIVIDEIGPMELISPDFRRAVDRCLESGRPILAVVHEDMRDPLAERFDRLPGRSLHTVSLHNRANLADSITEEILKTVVPG
jgi:nucleoside-triphosphatase